MAYVKIPLDFFQRDKRLLRLMALHDDVADIPVRLWCLAADESPRNGRLTEYTAKTLAAAFGWRGKEETLEASLIESGFLEKTENGYQVLNWEQDQGHIWKFKQKGKRAVMARWGRLDGTPSITPSITRSRTPSTA